MITKEQHPPKGSINFVWIDRNGGEHYPEDMETRHLFFTLRMIWNHSAPQKLRIEPYKRYRFGRTHTEEYMSDAVFFLMRELSTRDDLTEYFIRCLKFMQSASNEVLLRTQKL